MSKTLAIICNHVDHAQRMIMDPYHLSRDETLIITPERTTLMYGYNDLDYYEIRPMYAREASVASQHGWKKLTSDDLERKFGA